MKKLMVAALAMGVTGFLGFSGTVYADNITIWDGEGSGAGVLYGGEKQEVEPGMQTGQQWNLEGFFQEGNKLSIVGGSGVELVDKDVFNNFGYEYVLDINWTDGNYQIFDISGKDVQTNTVTVQRNRNIVPGSNPSLYVGGGVSLEEAGFGSFAYTTQYGNEAGFESEWHNIVSGFNLAPIFATITSGQIFTVHNTMTWGNDNLMGQGTTPVPEPGMLLLVGTAFAGLVNVRRKRIKRA